MTSASALLGDAVSRLIAGRAVATRPAEPTAVGETARVAAAAIFAEPIREAGEEAELASVESHPSNAARGGEALNPAVVEESEMRSACRSEAELLLAHVLGVGRAWLYAHGTDDIDAAVAEKFRAIIARRANGEPIAYLTGRREFFSLELHVTPDVLIPRADTELLVELALARIADSIKVDIADLGTGSGAVALALARERPQAHVLATDASAAALFVARANAQRLGLPNVDFAQGDWCAPLAGRKFDLIASNPPYIAATDAHLAAGDLRFEPAGALASGSDGLDAIRSIVAAAPECLRDGGWLLLEHGWDQGEAVRAVLLQRGFVAVETSRDLEGRDRVSTARYDAH